jgi:putative membrane protein
VLNAILKPILVILTLPITLVTFGLFLFVINAAIILLADKFIDGFVVDGFWWALLFSLLLSIVSAVLYKEEPAKQNIDN